MQLNADDRGRRTCLATSANHLRALEAFLQELQKLPLETADDQRTVAALLRQITLAASEAVTLARMLAELRP
jgi:hypothetical protein